MCSSDLDAGKEELQAIARADENVNRYLVDKEIIKEIFVAGRIYNIVVK